MAREYPRFIFSNPKNTKGKGPFIVHTLYPRGILKLENPEAVEIKLKFVELFDDGVSIETKESLERRASTWLFYQLLSKQLSL